MKKNDLILVAVLLLIAVAGFALFTTLRQNGDVAVLLIDGEETARVPLSENTEQVIETVWGRNTLVIRDGEAYVSEADCPDGICAAHRPISHVGETIVCLPHRVVIKVETSVVQDAPDMVVQ